MPPPSSGGIHIIQILNILEGYPLKDYGQNSAQTIHLMAEAMQLAYADRAEYLGDSDFIDVPDGGLTSQAYADKLRGLIDPNKATPASTIKANNPLPYESDQTTHFSIVDKDGNAIANTYTLNFSYGTGLVAEGTGILPSTMKWMIFLLSQVCRMVMDYWAVKQMPLKPINVPCPR